MEFWQSQGNHTLFIKHSQIGKLSALIIYFDDIIVPGDDSKEIERFKKQLTK